MPSLTALPFLYVETDVPAGLTLDEFRRTSAGDQRRLSMAAARHGRGRRRLTPRAARRRRSAG